MTATRLLAVRAAGAVEARASRAMLSQVGPSGTRVMPASTLTFPNATALPAGRLAMLLASRRRAYWCARGLGKVRADGGAIDGLAPLAIKSIEYLGYMPLTQAQSDAVANALNLPGSGVSPLDGGASFFQLRRERFARLMRPLHGWDLLALPFEGVAHAQLFEFGFDFDPGYSGLDSTFADFGPAWVSGKVRTPSERQVTIALSQPVLSDSAPNVSSFRRGDLLAIQFQAAVDTGNGADPSTAVVDAQLTATGPTKPIPADSSWHASATGQVTVAGNVPLAELGTTRIELTAAVGTDQRKVVLEAALAAAAADGGTGADSVLTLRKVLDTSETGGEAFQAVGLYAGIAVEVDGPGDGPSGSVTDGTGSYSVEVSPSGEEMGISSRRSPGLGCEQCRGWMCLG